MRIAIVADDLYPGFGGQAAATEAHIEALVARGFEVTVLAGREKQPSLAPQSVNVQRVVSWQLGQAQTSFALPDPTKIRQLLEGADLVQINTPTPLSLLTLMMARARGLPCVIGFHTQEESATTHFQPPFNQIVGGLLRLWYTFFYRQGDALSVPTPFAARLARRYTAQPKVVVSNGVRFQALRFLGDALILARKTAWLEGKTHLIAYVGRLAPEKRPEGMLEIMAALKNQRDDVRLLIAGRGPLQKALEEKVTALSLGDSVSFLGFISEADKAQLLRASGVFIMPSPTELQSIATIEAMAQGCAILAAKIESSAVSEMVEMADCGETYDLKRPDQAAEILNDLLNDLPRLERYQQNAVTCAEVHDLSHSGEALEGLYRSLVRQVQPKTSL